MLSRVPRARCRRLRASVPQQAAEGSLRLLYPDPAALRANLGCADRARRLPVTHAMKCSSRPTASNPSTRPRVTWTRALPRGLDPGEVANQEEPVGEPQREPCGPDTSKPDQEEDQARLQEQQGVTE